MSFLRGLTSRFMHRANRGAPRHGKRAGIVAAACAVVCLSPGGFAQEGEPAADAPATGQLALADAVQIALSANPNFAASLANARALQEVPSQAGALPDPMIGLNAMNLPVDSLNLDRDHMTQLQFTFSQAIPYPGNRRLLVDAAQFEADAGFARVEDMRLTLAARVRTTWWRLFQRDRALQIVEQNQALMRDFIEIARTRYEVGGGLQQDVLLAQLELSRLLERELGIAATRSRTEAMLAELLDRAPGDRIVLPQAPDNPRLPDVPAEDELLQQAVAAHPALAADNALVDAARARLDLSEQFTRPNFSVGAGYGYRQGEDPQRGGDRSDLVSVMFNVSVPLYAKSKQRRAIEQRNHEVSQRRLLLRHTLGSIQSAIAAHRADYEAAREQVELLETAIIPQAQQTVTSMLAAYQANEVDFLNVLNSQITLYNAQINYWDALGTAKSALAELAAASGQEVLYE